MQSGRYVRLAVLAATLWVAAGAARADAPGAGAHAAAHARKKKRAPKPPKSSDKCTTDADCALTTMADGDCCPTLCPSRGVTRASAEALARYAAECGKPEGGCPVPACTAPRIERTPACVNGRCVARAAPGPTRE